MSRILRELVGAREPAFSLRLRQLESATGNRTVDITATGDVLAKISEKIKHLKLDPQDTTSDELHAMLVHKAIKDDEQIENSYHARAEKIVESLNAKAPVSLIPIVKSSTLRKIIASCPPKKVMSALGFRSTASLLKRADIDQILVASFLLESVTWHRQIAKKLRLLPASDITMQRPRVVVVDKAVAAAVKHSRPVYVQFAGLVGILPLDQRPGSSLLISTQALEGLYHVHIRGVFLKLHRFNDDFQKTLVKITYTSLPHVASINKIGLSWQSLYMSINGQRHILAQLNESLVDPADFFWRMPNEALPLVHRSLDFWGTNDYLGRPTTYRPISLNISDIARDAYHLVPLSHSTYSSLSSSLTAELLSRYANLDPNHETTLRRLGIIT